jgi:hypothetical protein
VATSKNDQPATTDPAAKGDTSVDASVAEVQANVDEITEQGYQGTRTDPTPLENYTVEGVISGAPTPETDADAAAKAAEATGAQPQVR